MSASSGRPSTLTKMRQVYWEAKQSFSKTFGQLEDDFIVSSDKELDAKIELLQTADNSFNALMRVIVNYYRALQDLVDIEESFSLALDKYGKKGSSAAGKIMCMTGKAIGKAAQRQMLFKTILTNLFNEVQTFQFKAITDALKTLSKMEKARKSYRSSLMWLKEESMDIDPDIGKKLRNFRKVQEHIKRLKVKFDGVKLESMQKIDLLLLSRINLFSNTLVPYNKAFKRICRHIVISMDYAAENIPFYLSYNFVASKELNEYSNNMRYAFPNEQSSNKMFKKGQHTNSNAKSTYSSLSVESANIHTILEHTAKDNNLDSFPKNSSSGDTPLIHLNNEENSCALIKLLTEVENSSSYKYSDDLHSINFDNYQTANGASFIDDINYFSDNYLKEPNYQGSSRNETADLKFWSLIQSYGRASSSKELNHAMMDDSGLICPKPSSSALRPSNSKWDEMLIQFDPFREEMVGDQSKTSRLGIELC